jgi:hypothetical protein
MRQGAGSSGIAGIVCLAVGAALIAILAWTVPARADTCMGLGSTAKCTLDSQCCAGLVCNKRCQRGCKIGGVVYNNGTLNPANDCQSCQALVNRFGWTNLAASTTCGGVPNGVCDAQNTCNASGTCIENYKPSSTVCRSSAGVCDVAEHCTGSSKTCPTDSFLPSGTVCRPSVGVCDVAENCTGSAAACPPDAVQPSTTVCRSAAGVCDVAEHCTGSAKTCPLDVFLSSATICRSSAGVCDVAENCTGASAACPADGFASSATVCRSSAGVCDVAENCTGSAAACPPDAVQPSTTVCRPQAAFVNATQNARCDVPEYCDGAAVACPADGFAPSTAVCRQKGEIITGAMSSDSALDDTCDVADTCTGNSPDCPADAFLSAGTVCRSAAGICDVAEVCSGSAKGCPADAFQPSTYACVSDTLPNGQYSCEENVYCTGTSSACPASSPTFIQVYSPNRPCHPSTGPCDPGLCVGYGRCGTFSYDGYPCGGTYTSPPVFSSLASIPGACETAGTCDGVDGVCNGASIEPAATLCNPPDPTNSCSVPARCGGVSADCPAEQLAADGAQCEYPTRTSNPSKGLGTCAGGFCDPTYCKWSFNCPNGYICDTSLNYCVSVPQADAGSYGAHCVGASTGTCDPNSSNYGASCTSDSDCHGYCGTDSSNPGTPCSSNSDCQGGICPSGFCTFHGTCTGHVDPTDSGSKLLTCCAGVYPDADLAFVALGGQQVGSAGRCQECCTPSDCYAQGSNYTCCDGKCVDVTLDTNNCQDCAYHLPVYIPAQHRYSPGGINCNDKGLADACGSAFTCSGPEPTGNTGCIRASAVDCTSTASNAVCAVNTASSRRADCWACSETSQKAGEPCTQDTDCPASSNLVTGACVQKYGPGNACVGGSPPGILTYCSNSTSTSCTTDDDCSYCSNSTSTLCTTDSNCPGQDPGSCTKLAGSCRSLRCDPLRPTIGGCPGGQCGTSFTDGTNTTQVSFGFCNVNSPLPGADCLRDADCKTTGYGLGGCDMTCALSSGISTYATGGYTCEIPPCTSICPIVITGTDNGSPCSVDSDCAAGYQCVLPTLSYALPFLSPGAVCKPATSGN